MKQTQVRVVTKADVRKARSSIRHWRRSIRRQWLNSRWALLWAPLRKRLRDRRVARASRRLQAALAMLDRELKTAGMNHRERKQLFREAFAKSKTFTDMSDLKSVLK
jgi:hypothetical protein